MRIMMATGPKTIITMIMQVAVAACDSYNMDSNSDNHDDGSIMMTKGCYHSDVIMAATIDTNNDGDHKLTSPRIRSPMRWNLFVTASSSLRKQISKN